MEPVVENPAPEYPEIVTISDGFSGLDIHLEASKITDMCSS